MSESPWLWIHHHTLLLDGQALWAQLHWGLVAVTPRSCPMYLFSCEILTRVSPLSHTYPQGSQFF